MLNASAGPILPRIIAFRTAFARRQAATVVEVAGGFAVLDAEFAASYDHNKLILARLDDPAEAIAVADHVLGGAGLTHRLIVVNDDETGEAGAARFIDAGYHQETSVFMRHTGAAADRPADPGVRVEAVDWSVLVPVDRHAWREQLPTASEQAIEQLVMRRGARLRGADEVCFLAVRDGTGEVVAHAELYLDRTHRTAQIEQVMTRPEHERRGFARAIMAEGLRRALAAGCDLVFLEADANDWPRHFYARLGYEPVGRTHSFTRAPG
ncbi:MAG: GNAT family N-acetyltransferase [Micromonosporaceae bacterium]